MTTPTPPEPPNPTDPHRATYDDLLADPQLHDLLDDETGIHTTAVDHVMRLITPHLDALHQATDEQAYELAAVSHRLRAQLDELKAERDQLLAKLGATKLHTNDRDLELEALRIALESATILANQTVRLLSQQRTKLDRLGLQATSKPHQNLEQPTLAAQLAHTEEQLATVLWDLDRCKRDHAGLSQGETNRLRRIESALINLGAPDHSEKGDPGGLTIAWLKEELGNGYTGDWATGDLVKYDGHGCTFTARLITQTDGACWSAAVETITGKHDSDTIVVGDVVSVVYGHSVKVASSEGQADEHGPAVGHETVARPADWREQLFDMTDKATYEPVKNMIESWPVVDVNATWQQGYDSGYASAKVPDPWADKACTSTWRDGTAVCAETGEHDLHRTAPDETGHCWIWSSNASDQARATMTPAEQALSRSLDRVAGAAEDELLAPDALSNLLTQVGVDRRPATIAEWTESMRAEVQLWASAEQLHASDNDVARRPRPAWLNEPIGE